MSRPSTLLQARRPTAGAVPLFITQQSLKPVSGPAVQTAAFAGMFRNWRHLHWGADTPRDWRKRSKRLQSPLFAAWPFAAGAGAYKVVLRRLGADWWSGAALKPKPSLILKRWLSDAVNVIYAAPTTHAQAARMRSLIETIGRPYVLHYWDMLDGGMEAAGADTHLLLKEAHAVFALSRALQDELRPFRPDCRRLSFTREPASALAGPPASGRLKIAVIGHVASYDAGLRDLSAALEGMAALGLDVRPVYVGPGRQLRNADPAFRAVAQRTGFLKSSDERDHALSQCHIAFLSGPTQSPQTDLRSRFSIPSRLLDFAAVGLPIVATVHPASACADFLRGWGPAARLCQGPQDVRDAILALTQLDAWKQAHACVLDAFAELRAQAPEKRLRAELDAISMQTGPNRLSES